MLPATQAILAKGQLYKEDGKLKPIQHGFCSKVKAKFEIKENVKPVFRPKRAVPYASGRNEFAGRKGRFIYYVCDQEIS